MGKTKVSKKKRPTLGVVEETETNEEYAKKLMRKQSERIENDIIRVTSS